MLFLIAYISIGQEEHFLLMKSLSPALLATFTKTFRHGNASPSTNVCTWTVLEAILQYGAQLAWLLKPLNITTVATYLLGIGVFPVMISASSLPVLRCARTAGIWRWNVACIQHIHSHLACVKPDSRWAGLLILYVLKVFAESASTVSKSILL